MVHIPRKILIVGNSSEDAVGMAVREALSDHNKYDVEYRRAALEELTSAELRDYDMVIIRNETDHTADTLSHVERLRGGNIPASFVVIAAQTDKQGWRSQEFADLAAAKGAGLIALHMSRETPSEHPDHFRRQLDSLPASGLEHTALLSLRDQFLERWELETKIADGASAESAWPGEKRVRYGIIKQSLIGDAKLWLMKEQWNPVSDPDQEDRVYERFASAMDAKLAHYEHEARLHVGRTDDSKPPVRPSAAFRRE